MKNYAAMALWHVSFSQTLGAIASHAQVLMQAQVPDEYFLAEIWTNADSSVRMLRVSRRERQLAKAVGLTPQVAVVYGVWPSQSGN